MDIEEDINELKSIINLRTESGFAYSQKNTLKLQKSIRNILAERKQDKARIKELEEENRIFALEGSRVKLELYIKENYIPKQKVKNVIKKHKIAKEGFEKEYNSKHYKDDNVRARDFYMIVTEDRIIQVLENLLEDK